MGQIDYGPQERNVEAEKARRAAALKESGMVYMTIAGDLARERAALSAESIRERFLAQRDEDRDRLAAPVSEVVLMKADEKTLKTSGSGYTGTSLTDELLLKEQDAPLRPNKRAKGVSKKKAKRAARYKRTVGDYWKLICKETKAVYHRSKGHHGHQTTPWRGERSKLARQDMKMRGAEPWPTTHVPASIRNHEGDF